jgi:hypothetical protein
MPPPLPPPFVDAVTFLKSYFNSTLFYVLQYIYATFIYNILVYFVNV